ncbi:MAG: hypothetical protein COA78_27665 [Blastopirellula sp.]|nr:MAG: hypothetical protein COA78_27665 [Blastopirellula sp.]
MLIIKTVEEAIRLIESHSGEAKDFKLAVCQSLLDPTGVNMAIITDKILSMGWMPAGFEDHEGYRLFMYSDL